MRISVAKKDRGFAVIIALVAVTVLTLLAGAFAYSMKIESKLAANTNDDEKFYWAGRGGIERACWQLALEGGPFSSLQQYWAGGPGDGPETNGPLADLAPLNGITIGDASVSFTITEEESKININTANGPLLKQVLTTQGADADRISVVSDCILDWIDPDDNTRPAGAESDYYLGQPTPYYAKNAPIDVLEELLLIKGVTHKMYYNDTKDSPTGHQMGFGHEPGQEPDYLFGLRDVFTPYSSGQVNINTADETVLSLVPGLDDQAAQAIITARGTDPEIRDVGTLLAAAGLNNNIGAAQQASRYLTQKGITYEVHATVTIGQLQHEYTAVVARDPRTSMVEVFSFYRSK